MWKRMLIPLILILTLIHTPLTYGMQSPSYTYTLKLYKVYDDGTVNITAYMKVTDAPTNISLELEGNPLIGELYTPSGDVIPVTSRQVNLTVVENGTIRISYLTSDLTEKVNSTWGMVARQDGRTYVILPDNAVPVNFSSPVNPVIYNGTLAFEVTGGVTIIHYVVIPVIQGNTETSITHTSIPTNTGTGTSVTSGETSNGNQGTTTISSGTGTSYSSTTTGRVNNSGNKTVLTVLIIMLLLVGLAFFMYRFKSNSNKVRDVMEKYLDERDKQILGELEKGAKTMKELEIKTGIPKTPLHRRLVKLEKQGFIESREVNGRKIYFRKQ